MTQTLLHPSTADDAALLRAIADGDAGAFDRFVARHQRALYRYLYHRVGDAHRAEDLLQEVFLRIFRATALPACATAHAPAPAPRAPAVATGASTASVAAPAIDGAARSATPSDAANVRDLRAWMFTIAQRCASDYFRTCRRRPLALQSELGEASPMNDLADRGGGSGGARAVGDPLASAMSAESNLRVQALLADLPVEQQEIIALRIFADLTFPQIAAITHLPLATVKSRMRYALEKLAQRIGSTLNPRVLS